MQEVLAYLPGGLGLKLPWR